MANIQTDMQVRPSEITINENHFFPERGKNNTEIRSNNRFSGTPFTTCNSPNIGFDTVQNRTTTIVRMIIHHILFLYVEKLPILF